jgi:hypothetical protein
MIGGVKEVLLTFTRLDLVSESIMIRPGLAIPMWYRLIMRIHHALSGNDHAGLSIMLIASAELFA